MNIVNKFNIGLRKTSNFITDSISYSFRSKKISSEIIDELENILISADLGLEATEHLINKIKSKKITDEININSITQILADEIAMILSNCEKKFIQPEESIPIVFLFIGVNGSGKTTTIGKLIKKINNKKILVAACDTFRAAAVEQLKRWSDNFESDLFFGSDKQDPASVAYSACQKMKNEKYDYLIIDTAGRLSNNANLLNQLIKIKSVIKKSDEKIMIKTILVLDGTNGSNMLNQVKTFNDSLDVTGLIITKLDGTAKGGALISIAKKYQIPIHFIGLGETEDDLYEFKSEAFSQSILGLKKL